MLLQYIQSPKLLSFIHVLNRFYRSNFYILFIGLLTVLSEIFGWELPVYYLYVILGGVIPLFFCEDMISIIAPFSFGYFTVSLKHQNVNEGVGVTLFTPEFIIHLWILIALIALCFITRFIFDYKKGKRIHASKNMLGFLILALTFIPGGLFTEKYGIHSVLFGLGVVASFAIPYFSAYFLVDFEKEKKDYFARVLVGAGFVLIAEVLFAYFSHFDAILDGTFSGEMVRTGWGVKNNVGAMMVFTLPAPIYLALKHKRPFFYLGLNLLFFLSTMICQSRNAALVAMIGEVILLVYFFIKTKYRLLSLVTILFFVLLFVACAFLFSNLVSKMFDSLIWTLQNFSIEILASGRFDVYQCALDNFKTSPIFGTSFIEEPVGIGAPPDYFLTDIIPARYHDTYLQLLSSTGIIGLIGYLYHRYVTLVPFFQHKTSEKWLYFFEILVMIGVSVFDCHFFNIGPGIIYGLALCHLDQVNQIDQKERYLFSFEKAMN